MPPIFHMLFVHLIFSSSISGTFWKSPARVSASTGCNAAEATIAPAAPALAFQVIREGQGRPSKQSQQKRSFCGLIMTYTVYYCVRNSCGPRISLSIYHSSPHLSVGILFLVVHSRPPVRSRRPLPPSAPALSSNTTNSHTQLTHTQPPHTQLTHAQLPHTQLHTDNLLTHNSLTHNSLTQL